MADITADITYAPSDEEPGHITFSASTAKGEEWMGDHTVTVRIEQAGQYVEDAKADGLIVVSFP